jgi:hypothetical protein
MTGDSCLVLVGFVFVAGAARTSTRPIVMFIDGSGAAASDSRQA